MKLATLTDRRPTSHVTLDDLLADVSRAADVPADAAAPLLAEVSARQAQLAAVQSAIAARLVAGSTVRRADTPDDRHSRLLSADEAAGLLSVSRHWLYRHAPNLPFTVRLSAKAVKFDEAGLRRFIERRRS